MLTYPFTRTIILGRHGDRAHRAARHVRAHASAARGAGHAPERAATGAESRGTDLHALHADARQGH